MSPAGYISSSASLPRIAIITVGSIQFGVFVIKPVGLAVPILNPDMVAAPWGDGMTPYLRHYNLEMPIIIRYQSRGNFAVYTVMKK
jgi:hypothetical protein